MGELAQDLRHALRAIGRAPAFSAIAIGCLAVGIAVNAAAFSVLDALLLRDLPGVVRQKELSAILVSHETRWGRLNPGHLSPLDWEAYSKGIPGFSSSGVAGTASVALRLSGGPLAARAEFVSGEFFATLGARPAAGRLLTSTDDAPGAEPVAVIGHASTWPPTQNNARTAIATFARSLHHLLIAHENLTSNVITLTGLPMVAPTRSTTQLPCARIATDACTSLLIRGMFVYFNGRLRAGCDRSDTAFLYFSREVTGCRQLAASGRKMAIA